MSHKENDKIQDSLIDQLKDCGEAYRLVLAQNKILQKSVKNYKKQVDIYKAFADQVINESRKNTRKGRKIK